MEVEEKLSGGEVSGMQQLRSRPCKQRGDTSSGQVRKQPGAKERTKRKEVRCEFLCSQKNAFSEELYESWCGMLLRMGLVVARVWRRQAVVEATAGGSSRQERISFAISVMEVNDFEFEEALSTMATLFWTEEVWMSRWKQVTGLVKAVTCDTRDLGMRWPQWHTLFFVQGGHDSSRPAGCEEDAAEASQDGLLEEVGSKARV